AIGAGKFYQSEKICGACYQSAKHGICSTVNCTHEEMKIPSDDTVEIVLFDLAEQLKMLINKNIDLVKKYQDESQTQSTSDANDIVRGDVYQSILLVIQNLPRIKYSLIACFQSYKYVTAIKDSVDNVYIVVKHMEPSLCESDCGDVYPISTLCSRRFSVPFGDELMFLTNYSCAYEHN
ncbi:unnamed protein product, partial [Rotaria magnacalcarata]